MIVCLEGRIAEPCKATFLLERFAKQKVKAPCRRKFCIKVGNSGRKCIPHAQIVGDLFPKIMMMNIGELARGLGAEAPPPYVLEKYQIWAPKLGISASNPLFFGRNGYFLGKK